MEIWLKETERWRENFTRVNGEGAGVNAYGPNCSFRDDSEQYACLVCSYDVVAETDKPIQMPFDGGRLAWARGIMY